MTVDAVTLEPVVSWPRLAAPGGRYLVTVDLRTGADAWPYPEEEYAVGLVLSAQLGVTVETLGQTSVVLHRFGGTYGAARFVVTVGATIRDGTESALWLTLLSAGGVPFHTTKLPMTVTPDAPVRPPSADVRLPAPAKPEFEQLTGGAPPPLGTDVWSVAMVQAAGRTMLALGGNDGVMRLMMPGSPVVATMPVGQEPVRVAAPKTGDRLAVSSGDVVALVEPASLTPQARVPVRRAGSIPVVVTSLCWVSRRDGDLIVAGTDDGSVHALDAITLAPVWEVAIPSGALHAIGVLEVDGVTTLFVGGANGDLTTLDTERLTMRRVPNAHRAQINHLVATPEHILTASDDGSLRAWNPRTLAQTGRLDASVLMNAVAEVPRRDGRWLVWGDSAGGVRWSDGFTKAAAHYRRDSGAVTALVPAPAGGRTVLVVLRKGGVVEIDDLPVHAATDELVDQQILLHAFAALDGPDSAQALSQVRTIWAHCDGELDMTRPLSEMDLPSRLPDDLPAAPDGPLAGIEDPAARFRAVVRRDGDVLILSIAMAGSRRRQDLDWADLTDRWERLTSGGTGALLGLAVVYTARAGAITDEAVGDALPVGAGSLVWPRNRLRVDGFAAWEVGASRDAAQRRLVFVGGLTDEDRLSRLTWSDGTAVLPPLGRYLLEAAKLRSYARRRDDLDPPALRDRIAAALSAHGRLDARPAEELAGYEAEVSAALGLLRQIRQSAQTAWSTMSAPFAETLPTDAAVFEGIFSHLRHDLPALEDIHERVVQARRNEVRVAFGVDVVRYSARTAREQRLVRERLVAMARRVVAELGIAWSDADRRPAGPRRIRRRCRSIQRPDGPGTATGAGAIDGDGSPGGRGARHRMERRGPAGRR